ncbi:M48 family metallopeptidase [Streptomyces sp. NPDC046805]|uniref:M48 family metallopeptidase n=1 Tax=Streptomyces sp. NPDC046805 TaxID=3155134 RepID=UPI0033DEA101
MTASLRAVRALLLLGGFYLLGVLLLTAVLVADWLLLTNPLVTWSGYLMLGVVFASVMLAIPVLRGMVAFLRAGRRLLGPDGHPAAPEEQPALWAEVRKAAETAGTRAPDELFLDADVNAAVAEQARLLGLRPGRRRLYLGVPLLAGLTVPELRAVLAHEFGHFGNHDTRLAGVVMRGRVAVLHTVDAFRVHSSGAHVAIGNLYVRYARFLLSATRSVGRRQELAADELSARHAGRDTTAAVLRRFPVLDAAHDHYVEAYARLGVPAKALPPVGELHGGFLRLLAARSPEALTALAAARRPRRPSPYDSHPPMSERVALVEALPDDGMPHDPGAAPAWSLLRDPDGVLAALESSTLPAVVAGMRRLDWPELVMARSVADAARWAEPLRTAVRRALRAAAPPSAPGGPDGEGGRSDPPELGDVLDAIDAGLLWMEVADRMPKPAQASRLTGLSARNFIRPAVWDGLAGLVYLHLVAGNLARPDIAWSGTAGLALPEEWETGMDAAIDAAVDDTPDTAALRRLLAGSCRSGRAVG